MLPGLPSVRSLIFVLVTTLMATSAVSLDARGAEIPTAAADADKQARGLFEQGQVHYSLGEYDQAIAAFRKAYELTSAPGLLFNIAQAHRLNGQCKEALEVYRHFIRLAPDSQYRAEADQQVAALAIRCGVTTAEVEASVRPPPGALATSPVEIGRTAIPAGTPRRWSSRRRVGALVLATGVAAGLAAGGLYWWNASRYGRWQQEDRRLSTEMSQVQLNTWVADQRQNDALLHSIQRADTAAVAIASVALAAIVGSALLVLTSDH
jgi:tetratricopeptide (TPR) repeat protein